MPMVEIAPGFRTGYSAEMTKEKIHDGENPDAFARAFADAWQEQMASWITDANMLKQVQAWMQHYGAGATGESNAAETHGTRSDSGMAASLAALRDAVVQCERRLASNEARIARMEAALYAGGAGHAAAVGKPAGSAKKPVRARHSQRDTEADYEGS